MKFNFQELFQKAKSHSVKVTNYRIKVEVSFLANFFVQYEKEPNVPIIKEFYATGWQTELVFPESYNLSFKVFVSNPSCIKDASVSLSIENMNDDGGILVKKFDLQNKNTNLDSEWFRISLY
jgi:hypothetical protein